MKRSADELSKIVHQQMVKLSREGHSVEQIVDAMLFQAFRATVMERGLAAALHTGERAMAATRDVFAEKEARVH